MSSIDLSKGWHFGVWNNGARDWVRADDGAILRFDSRDDAAKARTQRFMLTAATEDCFDNMGGYVALCGPEEP